MPCCIENGTRESKPQAPRTVRARPGALKRVVALCEKCQETRLLDRDFALVLAYTLESDATLRLGT